MGMRRQVQPYLTLCIVTWSKSTTLPPLPAVTIGSRAGSLECTVMAPVAVVCTLCAATEGASEPTCVALKNVLGDGEEEEGEEEEEEEEEGEEEEGRGEYTAGITECVLYA